MVDFVKLKQTLEYGIDEIFTYQKENKHVIYLAFRKPVSATEINSLADRLKDKEINIIISCGGDGKFDVSLYSRFFPQSIYIPSILGSSNMLFLSEKIEGEDLEIVLYLYYNNDMVTEENALEIEKLWSEIPLSVSSVKLH